MLNAQRPGPKRYLALNAQLPRLSHKHCCINRGHSLRIYQHSLRLSALLYCSSHVTLGSSSTNTKHTEFEARRMSLILLLLVLPFAQSLTRRCEFDSRIYKTERIYFDCLSLDNRWDIALCLLQRNGLAKAMDCASWTEDESLWFDISDNDNANDIDLVPSLDFKYDSRLRILKPPTWPLVQNDLVEFTPRGLIVAAAGRCSREGSCPSGFWARTIVCPYEDMERFIPCLRCHGVTAEFIESFEKFIRKRSFGRLSYKLTNSLMDWTFMVDCPYDTPNPEDVLFLLSSNVVFILTCLRTAALISK